MRILRLILTLACSLFAFSASAQGWIEFVDEEELFGVNLPHMPRVESIRYISEFGADLPEKSLSRRNRRSITRSRLLITRTILCSTPGECGTSQALSPTPHGKSANAEAISPMMVGPRPTAFRATTSRSPMPIKVAPMPQCTHMGHGFIFSRRLQRRARHRRSNISNL